MPIKERLGNRLHAARKFSEALLTTFHEAREWMHRVHPTANHALWFVGHIGVVDNSVLGMLGSPAAEARPDWDRQFGPNSVPHDDVAAYPPIADLLTFYRERRVRIHELLSQIPEARLEERVPPGAPSVFSDVGSVFELLPFHEGMHSGQLTVVRQALGHARIIQL